MFIVLMAMVIVSAARKKKDNSKDTTIRANAPKPPTPPKPGPKKFEDVITDKATRQLDFSNLYMLDGRYYFEIPDSLLKKGGDGSYNGY